MTNETYDTIVIGAGLAGLRAALKLEANREDVLVLERNHHVGGRLRTFELDGYLLDRGFQVLQTAYPEAQSVLDYDELNLASFTSGARIHEGDQSDTLVDPLRHPLQAHRALLSESATIGDLWKFFRLQRKLKATPLDDLREEPEATTLEYLREFGFSNRIIERFFRPFLGGIFLERELNTSSRMFEYVFKMFTEGTAALPAEGMGQIPESMVDQLDPDTVRRNVTVTDVLEESVRTESGETLEADSIVCAVDRPEAVLNDYEGDSTDWNATNCYYFAANSIEEPEPTLHLNPGKGVINNFCFPSAVQPNYSPDTQHLLSVTTLPEETGGETVGTIRENLEEFFGPEARDWRLLGRFEIPRALPAFKPETIPSTNQELRNNSRTYVCGDRFDTPSINGALASGRRAAEQLLADRGLT